MLISTFKDIIKPYSGFESFFYDRIVGAVLCGFFEELQPDFIEDLPQGGLVLDVGCGGGHIATMIADARPDARVIGLDLSPDQIRRASRRALDYGERVRFVEGSALYLPFEDQHFDAVVSVGSIKHWPDRLSGLVECRRVLRSGGRLLITETDRSCHFDDMNRFIERLPIPAVLRPVARMAYRTYVAGQSIDLVEARDLASQLGGVELTVERTRNGGLIFSGRRVDD